MPYFIKLLFCSVAALVVAGHAIAYSPWEWLANMGGIVLFTYLALACVALPGLTWWATAKLLKVL